MMYFHLRKVLQSVHIRKQYVRKNQMDCRSSHPPCLSRSALLPLLIYCISIGSYRIISYHNPLYLILMPRIKLSIVEPRTRFWWRQAVDKLYCVGMPGYIFLIFSGFCLQSKTDAIVIRVFLNSDHTILISMF